MTDNNDRQLTNKTWQQRVENLQSTTRTDTVTQRHQQTIKQTTNLLVYTIGTSTHAYSLINDSDWAQHQYT
jgi:hypothetical protein